MNRRQTFALALGGLVGGPGCRRGQEDGGGSEKPDADGEAGSLKSAPGSRAPERGETRQSEGQSLVPVRVDPALEIRTVVGLRPFRPSGFVVRREERAGKTLIHNGPPGIEDSQIFVFDLPRSPVKVDPMSRQARILGSESAEISYYHVMSRCVDRQMAFDDIAKAKFRQILRNQLAFSGVECLTFCLMGNHFHLLVGVPSDRRSLSAMSDAELLGRIAHIYDKREVALWKAELTRLCKSKVKADHSKRERIREGFFTRMHDLASFVGEVKQRFSQWHNRRWNRRGTLYEERYKSVLVEGSDIALRTMAAYIDLNPVRAKLVKDPADWRWSGYGEAVAGVKSSREALCELLEGLGFGAGAERMRAAKAGKSVALSRRWKKAQADYRCWLYAEGRKRREGAAARKGGFTESQIDEVEEQGGEIAVAELLGKRVRYFHDGAAIGCRAFLEEVFRHNRRNFGPRREEGARRMRGGNWGELMAMRDLRGE